MKVHFVGAGPGDPDLMTVKAQRLVRSCRICVYAGSLVGPGVQALIPEDAEKHDSASMSLEAIIAVCADAHSRDVDVIRLHSGNPSIYGAINEQMRELDALGIAYEVVPGVSSFQAAAAALRTELTAPEISQTIILTRTSGRTPLPEGQELRRVAQIGATLCLFLSTHKIREAADTLAEEYGAACPAAVVHRASWPDQTVIEGTLADIAGKVEAAGLTSTAMILVGEALSRVAGAKSRLYDATFAHGFRASESAQSEAARPMPASSQPVRPGRSALITLSNEGVHLLEPLMRAWPHADLFVHEAVTEAPRTAQFNSVVALTAQIFSQYDALIYAAPCGVAVRALAPNIQSKLTDPAVAVIDAGGRFVISLLSGHEGGANALAMTISNIIGAEPVITTATDALKAIIVGVGCRRGAPAEKIVAAVHSALAEAGLALSGVRLLASADIKSGEDGLLDAARTLGLPIRFIASEEIRQCTREFTHSGFVQDAVDLPAVAEPAALLAGRRTQLVLPRKTYNGITVAIARERFSWSESVPEIR